MTRNLQRLSSWEKRECVRAKGSIQFALLPRVALVPKLVYLILDAESLPFPAPSTGGTRKIDSPFRP